MNSDKCINCGGPMPPLCGVEEEDFSYDCGCVDDEVDEMLNRCGCRFCECLQRTEYGITCNFCLDGAHQG